MTHIAEWKLDEIMTTNRISNALLERTAKEQGNCITRQTIASLRKGAMTGVYTNSLIAIVPALQELCKEQITMHSLLVIKKEGVSASGLPYTSDPETNEILDQPEIVERLTKSKLTAAQELANAFS